MLFTKLSFAIHNSKLNVKLKWNELTGSLCDNETKRNETTQTELRVERVKRHSKEFNGDSHTIEYNIIAIVIQIRIQIQILGH